MEAPAPTSPGPTSPVGQVCIALNPNGGTLSGLINEYEYCYRVEATQPVEVVAFDIYTRTQGASVTRPAHIYPDIGGAPGPDPIATGSIFVGATEQFYTATFPSPVSVSGVFYVGYENASVGVISDLVTGDPGVGYFREQGFAQGWDQSVIVGQPSYRVRCAPMDLYWQSFLAEPQGPALGTALVLPGGLLGVSGEIESTDLSFSGDVAVRCDLDGGAAGDFSFTVSLQDGYGSFYHEEQVSQLNISPGETLLLEGVLDPDDVWLESGEGAQNVTSNVGFVQFVEVASPPQLTVDLVTTAGSGVFSPGSVLPGDPLSVTLVVENQGTLAASAFSVSLYASVNTTITAFDTLLGSVQVSGVPAGGFVQVAANALATSGLSASSNYYVGWIIDEANVVAESNEANNVGYISSPQLAVGQSGANYSVTTTAQGSYVPLGPSRSVYYDGTQGTFDLAASAIAAPFPISFFGQSVSQLWLSTKGFVKFGVSSAGATDYTNDPIPSSLAPNGIAALFWDDLVVGTTTGSAGQTVFGSLSAQVFGNAPSRSLAIQYTNMRRYQGGGYMSGQIWIHERPAGVNSVIELVYPPGQSGSWVDVSATIGIESPSGASGYEGPGGSPNISVKPAVNYRFQ